MAVDFFLKIDGIEGEAKVAGHENEIQLDSWSAGLTQSGTTHRGKGSGSGKVNFQDVTFTKLVDKSTTPLMQACATGRHIEKIVLTCRKAGGGDKPLDYLKITLNTCLISSHQMGGSAGGDDTVSESVTINFGKVEYKYVPQKDDGSSEGEVVAGYNIMTNEKV